MSVTTQVTRSTGSLLGVVSTVAGSVSSAFTAATKSISLLDNYVSNALEHQQERIDADNAQFSIRLQATKAMEMSELYAEIREFTSKSQEHHDDYAKASAIIGQAIEAGKARRAKLASTNG